MSLHEVRCNWGILCSRSSRAVEDGESFATLPDAVKELGVSQSISSFSAVRVALP